MSTKQHELPGVRVGLGEPRVISEGVGHHWFPRIARFGAGEVLVSHSIVADSGNLSVYGAGIHVSTDGGETWPLRYDAGIGAGAQAGQPDGSIAGPAFHTYLDDGGRTDRVRGHLVRYEAGGRRYVLEPWAVGIEGLPREVAVQPVTGHHGETARPVVLVHGDVIPVEGGILTTAYLKFAGDGRYTSIAIVSADGGQSWRHRSIVAGPEAAPEAPEGPCEACMVRLADGDLMCVMRVGMGSDNRLLRAYSGDEGRTWSRPDRLPASSVDPSLLRLENGVLVLTTGRPGIDLWVATDGRGEAWERVDLIAHHNESFPGEEHRIVPRRRPDGKREPEPDQTTAYTGMVEVAPNRVLLVYDRTPFGWDPVPVDSSERSRVYVLPFEVERH